MLLGHKKASEALAQCVDMGHFARSGVGDPSGGQISAAPCEMLSPQEGGSNGSHLLGQP